MTSSLGRRVHFKPTATYCHDPSAGPKSPYAGAVYQLVEGLESKHFSTGGEKQLLHIFTPHAEPASGDAGYDFKLRGLDMPSGWLNWARCCMRVTLSRAVPSSSVSLASITA